MKLTLGQIAEFVNADGSFDASAEAFAYSIDSRSIKAGELFFAVKGERLDGHDFVEQALANGAVAAVIRRDEARRYSDQRRLLLVEDTLSALQTLATSVRKLWGKPLIGLTGSAGKTTTKEAVAHVLATRFRVLKSEGNFNNHFGLPLTLLRLENEDEVAVIEMGMSHAGEIAALAKIALPDVGVVTNVAPVHLENFDSIEGIAAAKRELIEALPPHGTAILNLDDEYVSQFGRGFVGKVIAYGLDPRAQVRAANVKSLGADGSQFDVIVDGTSQSVHLPLVGSHNVYNALAAIAAGIDRGISLAEAAESLAWLKPANKRGEVLHFGNITLIDDCYNSNPKALNAMVDALAAMKANRRIVVAGEMLELGPASEEMHRECGRHMAERKIDILIGVRGMSRAMVDAASQSGVRAEFVSTPEDAGAWLVREARDGDVVLLKASRGVKLEKAIDVWKAAQSQPIA